MPMTFPAELLERALTAHGATLYRLALLLAGNEAGAAALLRAAIGERVAAWRESPPAVPPSEPELLQALVAAARANEAQRPKARRAGPTRSPGAVSFGPFALGRLPFEQRLALGLFLLLGYDGARIAQVSGVEPSVARVQLADAVRALGPAAGHSLTDRVSGELCLPVRESLADPGAGARHGAAVRGHLATCSLCRSFDQAWGEIVRAVEEQVRAVLRDRSLPQPLFERLVNAARPPRRRISPTLRLALPPLAVLALIAVLVLPGFLRAPVDVVERAEAPLRDPQELLALAVERQTTPPDRSGIWYGRYETQWYFSPTVYAPLSAELWLDPDNPARHRAQLTHADGGAPYELQLGNGRDRLYYALDNAYAAALYGPLNSRARQETPGLVSAQLDAEAQLRARDERLAIGPWSIGPSYLRQAQAAADLRVLGRQRDSGRTVQILSFSGISPLGLPPDAPGATAERVTVLLALDLEDGLLRSATELAGPAGAEQVSRVTWRLTDELWLNTGQQIDAAFDVNRAWTGVGEFSERGRDEIADPALPLIAASSVSDPARLLEAHIGPFWLPAAPPPSVERALLIWPQRNVTNGEPPTGLIYLGPGRRMLISYNIRGRSSREPVQVGVWEGSIEPGPTQRYSLSLNRPQNEALPGTGSQDASAFLLIDAFGFSRDEILAMVENMRPFDLNSLAAQDELFLGRVGDDEARAGLIAAASEGTAVPAGQAYFVRARQFVRLPPPSQDARQDPYRVRLEDLRPDTTTLEEWMVTTPDPVRYEVSFGADRRTLTQFYINPVEAWRLQDLLGAGFVFSSRDAPPYVWLPSTAGAAFELLSGGAFEEVEQPLLNGNRRFVRIEAASESRYGVLLRATDQYAFPYLEDLEPQQIHTEIDLMPDNRVAAVQIYVLGLDGRRTLIQSYEVIQRGLADLAAAPAPLRDGTMPEALYVGDFRDRSEQTTTTTALETLELNELQDRDGLYLLDGLELLYLEVGPTERNFVGGAGFLDQAIAQRLATRLTYAIPPATEGGSSGQLRVTQGPAGPFGAYLRVLGGPPWTASAPLRLTIDGREVEAWVGDGERGYLVLELDGTLIVAEGPQPWLNETGFGLLATLRPAE